MKLWSMKTWLYAISPFAFCFQFFHAQSQGSVYVFQSTDPVVFTDTVNESTINVNAPCEGEYWVNSVLLNIDYPTTGVLAVKLNGHDLTTFNGGNGANYTNTVLVSSTTLNMPLVTYADAPFTGTFASELNFETLSQYAINGPWTLRMSVPLVLVTGTLHSWQIAFTCLTGGISTALDETINAEDLRVYPNPANDVMMLATEIKQGEAKLFDASGQRVLQTELNGDRTAVDVSNLSTGVYTLMVSDNNTVRTRTVSVQR
jgi:hypothetical protein